MKYVYSGISEQNARASNMDSLMIAEKVLSNCKLLLAVICDGVGSTVDGAKASAYVVRELRGWFTELSIVDQAGMQMREKMMQINHELVETIEATSGRAASTGSALLLVDDEYFIVHCGDSRVYEIRGDKLFCCTKDMVSEQGRLTSYFGKRSDFLLDYNNGKLTQDGFLMCTDGLYKKLALEQISLETTKHTKWRLKKELSYLVTQAIAQGEQDNITAALVKIEYTGRTSEAYISKAGESSAETLLTEG